MNLVLDTNVLIVSISKQSPNRWLWDAFLDEKFSISLSTEILLEYEEIIDRLMGPNVSENVLQILDTAINVNFITRYFHWELIKSDPDDNKFVDCAVAANADFIITHDKHFNVLSEVEFPKVELATIGELKELMDKK